MRIITFTTQKGGSGKTSIAANLAVAASEAGERVVALDLDAQLSLANWGERRPHDWPAVDRIGPDRIRALPTILEALSAKFTVAILDTAGTSGTAGNLAMHGLCLIPARPTRMDIEATWPTVDAVKRLDRPFAFILNQCPPRSPRASEAAKGLQMLGVLAEPTLTQRADFQDALAAGLGVTEYNPQGKAAAEMRGLWAWIARRKPAP